MRRPSRGRVWYLGAIFLIYSCLQVYSDKVSNKLKTEELNESLFSTTTEYSSSGDDEYSTTSKYDIETSTTITIHEPAHSHPTMRPLRGNCTPPAIEQFPSPLMGPYARKHGGLVVHFLVAIFTFLGLAIVCDDYFVASLDRICEELKLSPDVAGATFMAAGSSAPELATVVIGVFFAKDDIGVSGVIGSAVFNIMFVISVCALCTGTVCQLNWWPLVRDCFFYAVSILVMLVIIFNDVISWIESLVMILFYVFYCIVLHFNTPLEKWAYSLKLPIKLPTKEENAALVTYKNIPETSYTEGQPTQVTTSLTQEPAQQTKETDPEKGYNAYMDPNNSWDPNSAWTDDTNQPSVPVNNWNSGTTAVPTYNQSETNNSWGDGGEQNYAYNQTADEMKVEGGEVVNSQQQQKPPQQSTATGVGGDFYKSKEIKSQDITNPLDRPVDAGFFQITFWYIVYPIHFMCRKTVPDCRTAKYKNWYPLTFIIAMVWISFYSYFMVWMITIIGATLGIPDTVMGLTFVAAGVSVPDALSSIAVIKEGYGDMAVSNAVGSNVFDILICLGLPWFIQTAIIMPGSHVNVISKGLTYSTLSLLSTVVFLLVATHLNGWKLDKRLGIVLMFWYLLFITIASLYELNVFGQLNPPECSSNF